LMWWNLWVVASAHHWYSWWKWWFDALSLTLTWLWTHSSLLCFGFGGTHTSDYGVFQSVIVHFSWNLIDNTVSWCLMMLPW
jgi:hypothetical protein